MAHSYTAAEMSWLKALTSAPDAEEEGEEPSASAGEGPLPDIETLINRHVATPDQPGQVLPTSYEDRLEGIIQANAFEAASEDADLSYATSGQEPRLEVQQGSGALPFLFYRPVYYT